MNTIVMNLGNLAVTEYTAPCTGVCGDYEAAPDGVHEVGGTLDHETVFTPAWSFGLDMEPAARRRHAKYVYVHGTGNDENLQLRVRGAVSSIDYTYDLATGRGHASRFVLGGGIKDSSLKLSFSRSTEGAFMVNRIELVDFMSVNRRW